MISQVLKDLVRTKEYREFEAMFKKESLDIRTKQIDRTKSHTEQGMESHARELAANAIDKVLKSVRSQVNNKPKPKQVWR